MNGFEDIEVRAKEMLGTLSLVENNWNWEVQPLSVRTNLPRTVVLDATKIVKDRTYRITSRKTTKSQEKTILIPKKIKFEDHSVM